MVLCRNLHRSGEAGEIEGNFVWISGLILKAIPSNKHPGWRKKHHIWSLHSGKLTNYGKSPLSMGKSINYKCAIFNSYVSLPEGKTYRNNWWCLTEPNTCGVYISVYNRSCSRGFCFVSSPLQTGDDPSQRFCRGPWRAVHPDHPAKVVTGQVIDQIKGWIKLMMISMWETQCHKQLINCQTWGW